MKRLIIGCLMTWMLTVLAAGFSAAAYGAATEEMNQENGDKMAGQISIRILTLNIHSGVDWNNRFDLDALAKMINELNPDIVGLQEVDRFWSSMSQFQDIPGELALKTRMFPAFSISRERNNGFFGNLVLSKYPIIQMWTEEMPGNLERRSYIYTKIMMKGVPLHFLTTHLGLSVTDRQQQVDAIFQCLNKLNGPVIITGDLNGDAADPAVKMLLDNYTELQDLSPYKGQGTFRGKNGAVGPKIDYIFVSPEFEPVNFQIVDSYVSDHLPVLAEVRLSTESSKNVLGN